jgi:hypothetical protein
VADRQGLQMRVSASSEEIVRVYVQRRRRARSRDPAGPRSLIPSCLLGSDEVAAVAMRLATLDADGPTGEVYEDETRLPW